MSSYSIKQLELVSGIKAHTIRIWERRYNLFSPQRTNTNIRRYSDIDVQLILNIALLLKNGYKISKISTKSYDEITYLTFQIASKNGPTKSNDLEPLLISILSFDQPTFKLQLKKIIEDIGIEKAYEEVIIPLLYQIGILWQTGMIKTTHEHFVTSTVKHIITSKYEALKEPKNIAPLFIYFLAENEYHEIGLLFYAYLAKKMGYKTLYFGQSTPIEDVIYSSQILKPVIIFTSMSSSMAKMNLVELSKKIRKTVPNCHLLITGYKANQDRYKIPKEITVISSAETFNSKIKSFKLK
jgi:MerR family transcriptional regulator, light-induced transcriptional regulator